LKAQSKVIDEATLRNVLSIENSATVFKGTLALARQELTTNIADGISAEAAARLALAALVDANAAAISSEQTTRATADSSLAYAITVLTAIVSGNTAGITVEQSARADADSAMATSIASLATSVGTNAANITAEQTARTTADSAFATSISTLSTTVGGHASSISSQQSTIDGLTAQSTVRLDVDGHVSGYGVYGSATTSAFIASVDQFAVATPSSSIPAWAATTGYTPGKIAGISGNTVKMLVCKVGGTSSSGAPSIAGAIGSLVQDGSVTWQVASRIPFSIVTSSTIINGVTVAPGMYVDGAMIVNATVNNAQIANLAVDDQNIASMNVSKLTAGSLEVGQYIRSAVQHSYGGSMDWDWSIDSNGTATFNNAVMRGGVYATYGSIGGILVDSTAIRVGQSAYNDGSGFFLGSDGKFSLGNSAGNRLTWDGTNLNIRSSSSGNARMEILNDSIIVYDASGTVRVKIGNLA
jgi:hypothetical protein